MPFFRKDTRGERIFIMKTVNGICTSAKIFSDAVEDYALAQIKMLCDNEVFRESKVQGCSMLSSTQEADIWERK